MKKKKKKTEKKVEKKKASINLNLVEYKVFFTSCVHKKMLRPEQENEIFLFFKHLGLTIKEDENIYLDALKKY